MNRKSIYTRPDKPFLTPRKHRPSLGEMKPLELAAPVMVDKATECHVTPPDVAARMVRYLGPQGDYFTLEPSAGTGQLARALLASGHSSCELCMVERHNTLAARLHASEFRGAGIVNSCFLEWASEVRGKVEFPRVIMNPPFSEVRKHVAAALSLLGRNGHECAPVLVALVPITFEHLEAETLEILPADTFATARVNTKIIRVVRS